MAFSGAVEAINVLMLRNRRKRAGERAKAKHAAGS
jgi:hypothetical protein